MSIIMFIVTAQQTISADFEQIKAEYLKQIFEHSAQYSAY